MYGKIDLSGFKGPSTPSTIRNSYTRPNTRDKKTGREKKIEIECEAFQELLRRSIRSGNLFNDFKKKERDPRSKFLAASPSSYYMERASPFESRKSNSSMKFESAFNSSVMTPKKPSFAEFNVSSRSSKNLGRPSSSLVSGSIEMINNQKKVHKLIEWNLKRPNDRISELKRTLQRGETRVPKVDIVDPVFLKRLVKK